MLVGAADGGPQGRALWLMQDMEMLVAYVS